MTVAPAEVAPAKQVLTEFRLTAKRRKAATEFRLAAKLRPLKLSVWDRKVDQ